MRNLTLLFVCAILTPQLWPTASGFAAIETVSDLGAASPFLVVWNDYWQSLFGDDDDDNKAPPPSNHTKEDHTRNATSSDSEHWTGVEKIVGSVKESVAEIEKSASGILKLLTRYVQQLQSNGTAATIGNATQLKAPMNATNSVMAN